MSNPPPDFRFPQIETRPKRKSTMIKPIAATVASGGMEGGGPGGTTEGNAINGGVNGVGHCICVVGNQQTTPTASNTTPNAMLYYKNTWWRKVAPCLAFLAAFSTAMALLLVWNEAAELRRQAFDANMTRDYVLYSVSMDNPQLIAYIREVHFKPTTHQELLNATQTSEEKYVSNSMQNKREGVYVEYISRIGAMSSTAWLDSKLNWNGVLILTDPRSFFEAQKSSRNSKTRVIHSCLSNDKVIKEITYHQESEVQVTKLGEGPNSLVSSDESLPTTRLKCFPLYSILLAYNVTTLDYLSLDSPDIQDGQVLDTIPWETIRILILSIRWNTHYSTTETDNLIDKLNSKRYKLVGTTDTGKKIFIYNALLKI
ncbi:PREDICTED: protein Star [Polistes dominula]|uniref:Protein Star n=1 Tax=Polistes dominula TaxID=743375 RepID=A0ABM1J7Q8_POLDO|nr:PREDICTED: protein Star [Polistes dominula]